MNKDAVTSISPTDVTVTNLILDPDFFPHFICPKGHRNGSQNTVTGCGDLDGSYCGVCLAEWKASREYRIAEIALWVNGGKVPKIVTTEPPKKVR